MLNGFLLGTKWKNHEIDDFPAIHISVKKFDFSKGYYVLYLTQKQSIECKRGIEQKSI